MPAAPPAAAAIAVGLVVADTVAPGVPGLGAGARGILPLRLGGQNVLPAGLSAEPAHVLLGVVPARVDHGALAPPPALVQGSAGAAALGGTVVPFLERDLVLPDGELSHLDLVHRPLASIAVLGTHHERPRRDDHHERAFLAVAKLLARS